MTAVVDRFPPRLLTPILRWAGGKRWLAEGIRRVGNFVSPSMYLEPFVGGAAVFLWTDWSRAVLGDISQPLISCYTGLAQDPPAVRRELSLLEVDRDTFNRVSKWRPENAVDAAIRLLYLNRTAYGGIYRENTRGQFNVPYSGDRDLTTVLNGRKLENVGAALKTSTLVRGDFEVVLGRARANSLIYCDPPYSLAGGEKAFRRYSHAPFDWAGQVRLAKITHTLAERGSTVIVSNAADETVRALYSEAQVLPIIRRSTLARQTTEHKEALYVLHGDRDVAWRVIQILTDALC